MDFQVLKKYTDLITGQIRVINKSNLSAEEKKAAIKALDGLSRRAMMDIVAEYYSRGPGRPKGAKKNT